MPTKIEWCDESWNPTTGCSPVSEGCLNCYARRMANRLRGRCGYPADNPFRVTFHPDRLKLPMRWKKPQRIFVNSMGDLFHDDIPFEWVRDVFRVMMFGSGTRHTYMILTKRPERLMKWMRINYDPEAMHCFVKYHPNIWLGVTAENQVRADERIPILLSIPAAVHFVSVEPMLGPVDLRRVPLRVNYGYGIANPLQGTSPAFTSDGKRGPALDFVIAGPETGPGARECKSEWIEDLWRQCNAVGVAFFDKRKENWLEREWPK